MEKNNAAKFAFFYMLSLVSLIFTALSTGIIIFQFINKNITDVLSTTTTGFDSSALKFAISAVIIAAPIYFVLMSLINKNLFEGNLDKESGIRKWLTYFIIFISSVVMIGWLIGTVNFFLDGELTIKFILKSITAILISAIIFSFYLYDIKRGEVQKKKDKIVIVYFVLSLFIVDSPAETRKKKIDSMILSHFSEIDGAINSYFRDYDRLPESLDTLKGEYNYIRNENLSDPETKEQFGYNAIGEFYELCANFRKSNLDNTDSDQYSWYNQNWPHDAGWQCIKQKIITEKDEILMRVPEKF